MLFVFMLQVPLPVLAEDTDLSAEDEAAIIGNWPQWDPEGGRCTTTTTSAGLPSNPEADLGGHILPSAKGGTGFEEEIDATGRVRKKWGRPDSEGGWVTFSNNVVNASTQKTLQDPKSPGDTTKKVSLQDLYRDYYITMRWRYTTWNWDGSATPAGSPEGVEFYQGAPRVLVTNPRTNKSIIAVVLEAGPAPWTGVDTEKNNTPKQGWVNPYDGTPAPGINSPEGYKGRVSGLPPQAIEDLEATQRMQDGSGDDLIYSWAPDQAALPGPTTLTAADPTLNEAACASLEGDATAGGSGDTCLAGLDGGEADGYKNGQKVRIHLCFVYGFRVNATIAVAADKMFKAAAADGYTFGGGSFRTMEGQIHLRQVNGCPNIYEASASSCRVSTAKPGYSNHQMGLAFDFTFKGVLIQSHSNPGFKWLTANAGKFGFKNFWKEPWHWSVDGN